MNFKDNIDEEHINAEKLRFQAPKPSNSWKDKALQFLSRSWLLLIVGAAAIAITVLHFQGKDILQAIRLTPLPSFGWEESIQPKVLPDKTEVYKEALKKEEKDRRQEFSHQGKNIAKPQVTRPDWKQINQGSSLKTDTVQAIDTVQKESLKPKSLAADTLKKVNSPLRKVKGKRKRRVSTTETPKEKKSEVPTTEHKSKL
ncbi:hypothetical protein OKW21_001527 [Catalinimonas alkaloidigena]|uniref:hypothetical protein n=1 Tax=Catalinimonas alkaloidigena TaxID=1075417 RepID=UPI002405B4F0|nr:hypothetical protein [Catalinimonas alkaloidigena]MDF9796264.1 hypothetical protein [Catalinimonas alkaloidigena]